MNKIIISHYARIVGFKTLWTKVHIMCGIFLTPALKLGLIDNHSSSGYSNNLLKIAYNSLLFYLSVLQYSCNLSPEPINYGKDECEYCRMLISDNRYGSEVITDKGKIYKFDSIECLVEYALEQNILGDEKQTFLVTDFSNPLKLVDAKSAFYVHNDNIRSPMGLNVSAFGNESDMQKFFSDNNGRKIIWLDVIELIKLSSM